MNVYYFGNEDFDNDNSAIKIARYFKIYSAKKPKEVTFIEIKPNQDLPFVDEKNIVIIDTVENLEEIKILNLNNFEALKTTTGTTVHDFDLGFQLKYLKKLGKLEEVLIIGIPMTKKINYKTVQSIFKKLVAQDMQGS